MSKSIKPKSIKLRLGRVEAVFSYVVDLDNEDMVQEAKEAIREDIINGNFFLKIVEDKKATIGDIPDFLNHEEEV